METKTITLTWKDKRIPLILQGDKELIAQISRKYKEIKFFCQESEVKPKDNGLIEYIIKQTENHTFTVENTVFAHDTKSTFLIIFVADINAYFVLNNNEVRIPLYFGIWTNLWSIMLNNVGTKINEGIPKKDFKLM